MNTNKQITIRMPRELLDKWLAALRSGEYKQCVHFLNMNGGFCCLGVLQHVVDGDVERDDNANSLGLPSPPWLADKGIRFLDFHEMEYQSPYLPRIDESAHGANDRGATFAQIADAIEACSEGY